MMRVAGRWLLAIVFVAAGSVAVLSRDNATLSAVLLAVAITAAVTLVFVDPRVRRVLAERSPRSGDNWRRSARAGRLLWLASRDPQRAPAWAAELAAAVGPLSRTGAP